jgi:hypothetical protein
MLGLLVAGCGGSAAPPDFWMAPMGDELHVQLSRIEPAPF